MLAVPLIVLSVFVELFGIIPTTAAMQSASPSPRASAPPAPSPAASAAQPSARPADPLAPTPPAVRIPVSAGPTPSALADGGPDFQMTLTYILSRTSSSVHASEVRAGTSPRTRYRIDYASAYAFAPGARCDLGVAETFVEAFTDTSEPVRGLDPPALYYIDDGYGRNVYSPAFKQATSVRQHEYGKVGGADRNTYTWTYAFVYHFNGVDLSRLRLISLSDPERREMFAPFVFTDRETGERVMRAVSRAATLCGARRTDPFASPSSTPDPFASPRRSA